MTRGPPPVAAIRDAKKFAKKMGYFVQENTENPSPGQTSLHSRKATRWRYGSGWCGTRLPRT